MNDVKIEYARKAEKFLDRNAHRLSKEDADQFVLKGVRKIHGDHAVSVDLIKMKGRSKGKYRLSTGDIRIIFSIKQGIVYVVLWRILTFAALFTNCASRKQSIRQGRNDDHLRIVRRTLEAGPDHPGLRIGNPIADSARRACVGLPNLR